MTKKRTKVAILLLAVSLVLWLCGGLWIAMGNEAAFAANGYVDQDGNEIVFDKNGVTQQKVYFNGEALPYNGIYEPASQYRIDDDGSVFVLAGAYTALGGEMNANYDIVIRFLMDPDKAWGQLGTGRFFFALYDGFESLYTAGPEGWNPANGSRCVIWGALNPTDNNYHKIVAGTGWADFDYTENFGVIRIHIAEDAAESAILFNGKKITSLNAKRSDFADGKVTLSLTALDAPLQAKMQIRNEEEPSVKFTSAVEGFKEWTVNLQEDGTVSEPMAPQIEGYTFVGWFADESMIRYFDFSSKIEKNTTVYAKYKNNSKEYVTLTLHGDDVYEVPVEKGEFAPDLSDVFVHTGFTAEWITTQGTKFDLASPLEEDTELFLNWTEDKLVLYHKEKGVVDEKYMYEYLCDENGWDREYTDFQREDTFVDKNGNVVISSFYGGYQHEDSFITQDEHTIFLLLGVGSITNLKRLDVSREIVIRFNMNNWDESTGGFGLSNIVLSLFDNLYDALKTPNPGEDANAKIQIKTSNYKKDELCGKFQDVTTGIISKDFGYEQDKWFTVNLYISEDGTANYLKVNGETIEGALAGVKRSDFTAGYAYLHFKNHGCTTLFKALVSQTSKLTIAASQNGTVSSDLAEDGIALFKQKIILTCVPAQGYKVKCARIGEKVYLPDNDTYISIYKGWEDEEVTVEFSREFTMTFDCMGGGSIPSQSVVEGEYFYKPANPKREGYKFDGWYSDREYNNKAVFTDPATANVTVYAKWSKEASDEPSGCGSSLAVCSAIVSLMAMGVVGAFLVKKNKRI